MIFTSAVCTCTENSAIFRDVAFVGAVIGAAIGDMAVCVEVTGAVSAAPQPGQNDDPTGACAPHFVQYTIFAAGAKAGGVVVIGVETGGEFAAAARGGGVSASSILPHASQK